MHVSALKMQMEHLPLETLKGYNKLFKKDAAFSFFMLVAIEMRYI